MAKESEKSLGDAQTRMAGKEPSGELDTAKSLGDSQTLIGGLDAVSEVLDDGLELTDLSARYTIVKTLGQGGMGEVQLATDNRLKRQVAIKRIRGEQARSRTAVKRFLTEAQAIAALNHPNIVQVYDYGRDQEGPFLIMEYVDGQSLLERCRDNPLPVEEAVELTCELLGGLGRAHELGIVHRDIKPANILLTKDGRPKLTDFGLAKQTTADHGQTVTGAVLGTIDFMPPEQRRDATLVDARSDLWSLAATLYQMLTGKSPKIIRFDLLPKQLAGPAAKALEEEPKERFQTAAEFREALRQAMQAGQLSGSGELVSGQCPNCGTQNAHTVRFCKECSAPLKVPCLGCNAEIPVWDKGCTECGSRQAELLEKRRAELAKLQSEVDQLSESGNCLAALQLLPRFGQLRHPRLEDYRHWLERIQADLEEQTQKLGELASRTLEEAQAHRSAWDYPAALRVLKKLPRNAWSSEHHELSERLQAEWTELQQTLQQIQQRVKTKQLDGLLPLVRRALELRGDRADLKKLLGQLEQREQYLSAPKPAPIATKENPWDFSDAMDSGVTLPGFMETNTSQKGLGKGLKQLTVARFPVLRWLAIIASIGAFLLIALEFKSRLFSSASAQNSDANSEAKSNSDANPKENPSTETNANSGSQSGGGNFGLFGRRASGTGNASEVTNSIGMKLKLVSPGTFNRGEGAQGPAVTLTTPYYLGVYEVTQSQYEKVMRKGRGESLSTEKNYPAAYCSWDDAVEFCRLLSELPEEKKAGRVYRLPTEAEWEYACRAGSKEKYCFGVSEFTLNQYCWFEGNSTNAAHEVGGKKPNAWGFYDMHGNVWEWCSDWFAEYGNQPSRDPTGPKSGKTKVLRGGSWSVPAKNCTSAFRDGNLPANRFFTYGVRVVLEAK